jgi:hypothetical protein
MWFEVPERFIWEILDAGSGDHEGIPHARIVCADRSGHI